MELLPDAEQLQISIVSWLVFRLIGIVTTTDRVHPPLVDLS